MLARKQRSEGLRPGNGRLRRSRPAEAYVPGGRRDSRYSRFCLRSPRTWIAMYTTMMFTTTPMPPNVAIRPMVLSNAALAASMREAYQRHERKCRSLGAPPPDVHWRTHGEVPERLNGRDWKSRNGGNLVRGFESLPLRFSPST